MPIVFQSPQPFSAAAFSNRNGGGSMGGYQSNNLIAGLLEASARNTVAQREGDADRRFRYDALAASREVSARDQFQQAGEIAAIQARAEQAAWLNQQEMTQRDVARLNQMKQAVSAVQADQTLTPEEKERAITMLRTGIDPLEMRMKTQQQQAETKFKNAKAEEAKAHAAFQSMQLKGYAAEFNGRDVIVIDGAFKSEYADLARLQGLDPASPAGQAFMNERAMADGNAHHGYMDSKNNFVPYKKESTTGSSGTGGKAKEEDHGKEYDSAREQAVKELTTKDEFGKPIMPDEAAVNARIDSIIKARREHVAKNSPEAKKAAETEQYRQGVRATNDQIEAIQKRPDLIPEVKAHITGILKQISDLRVKFPPDGRVKPTDAVRERMRQLQRQYDELVQMNPSWAQSSR